MVLAIVAAGASEAGEVNLGADSKVGYDSNVFNGRPDDVDSAEIMFKLRSAVHDELERGSYSASYSPAYFINTSKNANNTWNHRAEAGGELHFSPRTTASLNDTFQYLEKVTFSPSDPDTDPNVNDQARKRTINTTTLGFSHLLTQRLSFYANSDYTLYRYNREQDQDSDFVGGSTGMRYQLSRQISVGGGAQGSYRAFDSAENNGMFCGGERGPGSHSVSYSGFASGAYQYDETTSVEVQAGPAWIDSTTFQCTALAAGSWEAQDTNQTTWFASGALLKRWQFIKTSVRYQRSEGVYGGNGLTSVNDQLTARLDWQPARFWDVELRLGWIRRAQDGARNPTTQIRQNPETTTWTAALQVQRQVAKRTSLFTDVSYRNQTQDRNIDNPLGLPEAFFPPSRGTSFDVWRVFFGISYTLDPIRY